MTKISQRIKFITRQIVEPKIRTLIKKLKEEFNDDYFELKQEEKELVAKSIMSKSLDETAKLFSSAPKYYNDPKFIYSLSIHNLTKLNEIFEKEEMYCYCQMLCDAIKLLNDEFQSLVGEEL